MFFWQYSYKVTIHKMQDNITDRTGQDIFCVFYYNVANISFRNLIFFRKDSFSSPIKNIRFNYISENTD